MAPSLPMARPEVGRPLQSLEVQSIIMTEGSFPELFLTFIIISAGSVYIFICHAGTMVLDGEGWQIFMQSILLFQLVVIF